MVLQAKENIYTYRLKFPNANLLYCYILAPPFYLMLPLLGPL